MKNTSTNKYVSSPKILGLSINLLIYNKKKLAVHCIIYLLMIFRTLIITNNISSINELLFDLSFSVLLLFINIICIIIKFSEMKYNMLVYPFVLVLTIIRVLGYSYSLYLCPIDGGFGRFNFTSCNINITDIDIYNEMIFSKVGNLSSINIYVALHFLLYFMDFKIVLFGTILSIMITFIFGVVIISFFKTISVQFMGLISSLIVCLLLYYIKKGDKKEDYLNKKIDQKKTDHIKEMQLQFRTTGHNIGTPLTSILYYVEELEKKFQENNLIDKDNYFYQINIALNYIRVVYLNMMNKVKMNVIEVINIREIVKLIIDMSNGYAKSRFPGVKLIYDVEYNVPINIKSSRVVILQIIMELLANAIKQTDQGTVKLKVSLNDSKIKFCVIDEGPGIESDSKNIFKPYVTDGNGYGLGLSSVKQLADSIDGFICAYNNKTVSSKKIGATFVVELNHNLKEEREESKEEIMIEIDTESKETFDKLTILVLDDNRFNLEIIKMVLLKYEIQVVTSDNGLNTILISSIYFLAKQIRNEISDCENLKLKFEIKNRLKFSEDIIRFLMNEKRKRYQGKEDDLLKIEINKLVETEKNKIFENEELFNMLIDNNFILDTFLLDFNLPYINGGIVAKEILNMNLKPPIIMLSSIGTGGALNITDDDIIEIQDFDGQIERHSIISDKSMVPKIIKMIQSSKSFQGSNKELFSKYLIDKES